MSDLLTAFILGSWLTLWVILWMATRNQERE